MWDTSFGSDCSDVSLRIPPEEPAVQGTVRLNGKRQMLPAASQPTPCSAPGELCELSASRAGASAHTHHSSAACIHFWFAGGASVHVLYICSPYNPFSSFPRGKVKAVSFLLPTDVSYAGNQGSFKSPPNQDTKQLSTITEKDMWAGEFLKARWFSR